MSVGEYCLCCHIAVLPHLLLGLGGLLFTSGLPPQLFMLPQSTSRTPLLVAHGLHDAQAGKPHYDLGYSPQPSARQTKPQRSRSPARTRSRALASMQEAPAAPEVLWKWVTHFSAGVCQLKSNAPQDHTQ